MPSIKFICSFKYLSNSQVYWKAFDSLTYYAVISYIVYNKYQVCLNFSNLRKGNIFIQDHITTFYKNLFFFPQPIFLNRNLTYMKHRMSRTHTARKTFTVDSMLEKIKAKQTSLAKSSKEYLTVSYIGYFDKNGEFLYFTTLFFFFQ